MYQIKILIAQKGRSHLLLKDSKRKDTLNEIRITAGVNKNKLESLTNENWFLKDEIEKLEENLEKSKMK